MQLTLNDVAVRGAGVAWKGDAVHLGVKFEAPFSAEIADQLGIRDNIFNGGGGARKFLSQQTGLVVPEAKVHITVHPDMPTWAFEGKFGGLVILNQKDGLQMIFRIAVPIEQPMIQYLAAQKKNPVLEMTVEGMTQSSLDFDAEDSEPSASDAEPGKKKRGRPRKK
jgi:hypothetical protein